MVVKIADNILSPLGMTTAENYLAVKAGRTGLRLHPAGNGVLEPFYASLMADEEGRWKMEEGRWKREEATKFERMCIQSVTAALSGSCVDASSDRVVFVVSTTKGNVELLAKGAAAKTLQKCTKSAESGNENENENENENQNEKCFDERVLLGNSAQAIARHFGNRNRPIVVSNACISGLCAQILAQRLLLTQAEAYDYVIAVGADVQSPFIINGFRSLKALSDEACRPFDAARNGLNLGEAAATIVYGRTDRPRPGQWALLGGAIRNDANHISGPSRTGEGSYLALREVLKSLAESAENGNENIIEQVAFVNAHGTATLYNDEMESIALTRAGLSDTPINSLKGYYGHTMGAAGLLETLVSMSAVEDCTVLATKNFSTLGVSNPINVSNTNGTTDKRAFIKLISGFGGCNAAAAFKIF